jgi:opacity protein-like surface antigen
MGALKAVAAIWLSVSVSAAAAQSLPTAPSLDDLEARGGFANEQGLYLRADVGLAWQYLGTRPSSLYAGLADFHYRTLDIEATRPLGVGIGYRSHDWFRFDLTSEYRSRATIRTTPVYGCGTGTCTDPLTSDLRSLVTMLNGYFEIGSWHEITPYLGLGLGLAHHRFGPVTIPASTNNHGAGTTDSRARQRLALSLMAGAAYDLSDRMKLDIGYRYLHAGRIESGSFDCSVIAAPSICNGGTQSLRVQSHELRIGLRFLLQQGPALMAFSR